MSKTTQLNKRIGFTAVIFVLLGVFGYFVALFQAYGLVGRAENNVAVFETLRVIMIVQVVCKVLIASGIVIALILPAKRMFFK